MNPLHPYDLVILFRLRARVKADLVEAREFKALVKSVQYPGDFPLGSPSPTPRTPQQVFHRWADLEYRARGRTRRRAAQLALAYWSGKTRSQVENSPVWSIQGCTAHYCLSYDIVRLLFTNPGPGRVILEERRVREWLTRGNVTKVQMEERFPESQHLVESVGQELAVREMTDIIDQECLAELKRRDS